jgi:hypothetical protein
MRLSTPSAALLISVLLLCSANAQTVIYDGSQDLNFFSSSWVSDDIAVPLVPNPGDGIWLRSSGRRMRNVDSANGIGLASSAAGVDGVFFTANPTENNPDPANAADREARGTGAGYILHDAGMTTGPQTLSFSVFYNDATPNADDPANAGSGGNVAVRVYGVLNSGTAGDPWATDDFQMLAGSGTGGALIAAGQYRDMDAGGAEPVIDLLAYEQSAEEGSDFFVPMAGQWQDLSVTFDTGTGYDYLVFGFGGAEQDDTNLPADRYGFDNISFEPAPAVSGDFDGNGFYECADVDLLVSNIATGSGDLQFDLTGDNMVDEADLDAWRAEAGSVGGLTATGNPILPGDANLDGEVDGQDFVIWNSNKFTDTAAWCAGDFNADGSVNGQDFVAWNAFKFQSANDSLAAVPEPSSIATILLLAALAFRRQR